MAERRRQRDGGWRQPPSYGYLASMNGTPRATGIEAARQLDQTGRFAEAMDALKAASLEGDLVAMTELGHRLLVGDRAPKSPKHALYLLHESAKQGEARALARIAAL